MNIQGNGTSVETGGVGPLLRRWREARLLSQLDLANGVYYRARAQAFQARWQEAITCLHDKNPDGTDVTTLHIVH